MSFFMRPKEIKTRLRNGHDTLAQVVSSWGPSDIVECAEEWVAPRDLFNAADGNKQYQKAGDRWAKVLKINNADVFDGVWMAITNMGALICDIVDAPAPPQPFEWPATAKITLGEGQQAVYGFLYKVN